MEFRDYIIMIEDRDCVDVKKKRTKNGIFRNTIDLQKLNITEDRESIIQTYRMTDN
jgi:hypothetical protein